MVFQVPQNWDVAIDAFQILLCLLILGFYIKNRIINKKCMVNRTNKSAAQSFNAHVFNITVQQQVNQAFNKILEAIAAERNVLESVIGLNPLRNEDGTISKLPSNSKLPISHDNDRISVDRSVNPGRYDKVRKFSAKGLSARKISEELKIPMGAVELILSLQKN
jgi:uncharacterized protein YneF (UPF0154 family)